MLEWSTGNKFNSGDSLPIWMEAKLPGDFVSVSYLDDHLYLFFTCFPEFMNSDILVWVTCPSTEMKAVFTASEQNKPKLKRSLPPPQSCWGLPYLNITSIKICSVSLQSSYKDHFKNLASDMLQAKLFLFF